MQITYPDFMHYMVLLSNHDSMYGMGAKQTLLNMGSIDPAEVIRCMQLDIKTNETYMRGVLGEGFEWWRTASYISTQPI